MALQASGQISHSDICAEFGDDVNGWRLSQDGGLILQSLGDPKGPNDLIKESDFYNLTAALPSVEYTLWDAASHTAIDIDYLNNPLNTYGAVWPDSRAMLGFTSNVSQAEFTATCLVYHNDAQQWTPHAQQTLNAANEGIRFRNGANGGIYWNMAPGITFANAAWGTCYIDMGAQGYKGTPMMDGLFSSIGVQWTNHKFYTEHLVQDLPQHTAYLYFGSTTDGFYSDGVRRNEASWGFGVGGGGTFPRYNINTTVGYNSSGPPGTRPSQSYKWGTNLTVVTENVGLDAVEYAKYGTPGMKIGFHTNDGNSRQTDGSTAFKNQRFYFGKMKLIL